MKKTNRNRLHCEEHLIEHKKTCEIKSPMAVALDMCQKAIQAKKNALKAHQKGGTKQVKSDLKMLEKELARVEKLQVEGPPRKKPKKSDTDIEIERI